MQRAPQTAAALRGQLSFLDWICKTDKWLSAWVMSIPFFLHTPLLFVPPLFKLKFLPQVYWHQVDKLYLHALSFSNYFVRSFKIYLHIFCNRQRGMSSLILNVSKYGRTGVAVWHFGSKCTFISPHMCLLLKKYSLTLYFCEVEQTGYLNYYSTNKLSTLCFIYIYFIMKIYLHKSCQLNTCLYTSMHICWCSMFWDIVCSDVNEWLGYHNHDR